MNKIKTVVIVNDFDYVEGGASKVAIDTANILYKHGINVIFFSGCHSDKLSEEYKFKSICLNQRENLKNNNKLIGAFNDIYNLKAKKEFSKLLDSLDKSTTIIHVHTWTKCLSSVIFSVAYEKKFKIVLTLHDYFTICPNGGFFNYKTCKICDLNPMSKECFFCNCDSRNYFFKIYRCIRQSIQNKNIVDKIQNVIYISDFSWKILKKHFSKSVNSQLIHNPINIGNDSYKKVQCDNYYLYVGRISREKGTDIFCKMIDKSGLKGIVIGDGPLKEELSKKYSKIKFLGWKSKEEVKGYMAGANALILPSRLYEVAPLTPLESYSVGRPVIISNCCAARDYLTQNNGILIDINNINESVEKLLFFDKNKEKYKFKSEKYDLELYFNQLIKFYKNM